MQIRRFCSHGISRFMMACFLCAAVMCAVAERASADGGDPRWQFRDTLTGKQEPRSSAVDSQGNMILAGFHNLAGNTDDQYLTVKITTPESGAAAVWRATYDHGSGSDQATAVAVDSQDAVLVTGHVWNGLNNDIHTIKYSSSGVKLWEHSLRGAGVGNEMASSIAVDRLDNVYVAGSTQDAAGTHYYLVKYAPTGPDALGRPLWEYIHSPGSNSWEQILSVAAGRGASEGSIAIAVTGQSSNGSDLDGLTLHFDADGNLLNSWTEASTAMGGSKEDRGKYVKIGHDGAVHVTGITANPLDSDIFTVKYGYDGTQHIWVEKWRKLYSNVFEEEPHGLALDRDGNVYVTGSTWTADVSHDIYTASYSSSGQLRWEKTFNSFNGNDDIATPTGIVVDELGELYVAGYTVSYGNYDFQTLKYKKDNGAELWHSQYDGPTGRNDRPVGIAIRPSNGDVLVSGWTDNTVDLENGTSTGGTVVSLTETGKEWTANQWAGYHVMFTDGVHAGITRHIESNNGDTLNFALELGTAVSAGEGYFIFDQEDIDYTLLAYEAGLLYRPTSVTAVVESDSSVTLTWQDNSANETGFNVYRRVGETGSWVRLEPAAPALPAEPTVGAGSTSFHDTTADADTRYYYYLTAAGLTGESYPSDLVEVLTSFVSYSAPAWAFLQNSPDGGNQEDYAAAIAVGPDNQPVVTGKSLLVTAGTDYYTLKLDRATGAVRWSHIYDDPDQGGDEAVCVSVDRSSNVVVSGFSELFNGTTGNTNHIYSLKYPASGPQVSGTPYLWHHKYVGSARIDDRASAIASAIDSSNNVAVVGYGKNAALNEDIYLMKYRETPPVDTQTGYAVPDWTAVPFDNGSDDFPNAVAFGPTGDIYVTGYSKNTARGDFDIFTARYNSTSGAVVWKDLYHGGFGDDHGAGLVVDTAGDVYVTGYTTNATGTRDMIVLKYKGTPSAAPAGEQAWGTPLLYTGPAQDISGTDVADDFAVSVALDPLDGRVIVGGSSMNRPGEHDFTVLAVDPATGILLKPKSVHRQGSDNLAAAMALDASGNVIISGSSSAGGASNALTLKLDYSGNLLQAVDYDGPGHSFDEIKAVAVNALGEAFAAGYATNDQNPPTADYLVYKLEAEKIQAPHPVSATPTYTSVALSWPDLSTIETGYRIQRKSGSCSYDLVWGEADVVATLPADTTTHVDAGLAHSQSYCYRVVATGSGGNDSRGAMRSVATPTPVAPTALTAIPVNSTRVDLSWTDTTAGETGFLVERCIAGSCSYLLSQPNSATYVDTSVCTDVQATYRVMAVNQGLSMANGGSWTRRRPLTVTNFQANFQIRVTVPYDGDTVSAGSPMKSDFSDIRFYDATSRTELPYWIDAKTDGTSATVWLKTGASSNIVLYYGNPAATSSASGKTVFDFFDDFDGTTLGAAWYKGLSGVATITVADGVATLDATLNANKASSAYMSTGLTPPYRVEARVIPTSSYQSSSLIRNRGLSSGSSLDIGFFNYSNLPVEIYFGAWTGIRPTADQYLRWRATHLGYEGNEWAVFKDDGTQLYSTAYTAASLPGGIHFSAGDTGGGNGRLVVDRVYARKYAAVEPVTAVGAIERQSGGYSFSGTYVGFSSTPLTITLPRPGNQTADWDFDTTTSWSGTVGTLTGTSFDAAVAYSGAKSMKLTATGATLGRYQTVSVRPGVQYILSGYLRTALTAGSAQCDLYSASPVLDSAGIVKSGMSDWSYLSETVTIPTGVSSVQLRCFANGTPQGNAWFDMVQLVPSPVVSGTTVTRGSEFRANLTWQDNTTDETAFQIERKCLSGSACPVTPDAAYAAVTGGTLAAGTTSFSDSGLVAGTTYSYRVKAVKDGTGACRWEAPGAELILAASNDPPTLTAAVVNTTKVNLSWTDTLETATSYTLQRCADSACSSVLASISWPSLPKSYPDTAVCAGTSYWYQIRGVNSGFALAGGGSWTRRARLSFSTFVPNHQVRIVLTYDGRTDLAGSPMKSDFSDIRFYDAVDHRELPYWIESKTNGSSAVVWIKTGTRAEIDLYYGNSLALDGSSGVKTFDLFEDFAGATLDTSKWIVNDPNASITIQNGELLITSGQAATPTLVSSATLPRPLIFEANYLFNQSSGSKTWFGLRDSAATPADQNSFSTDGSTFYVSNLGSLTYIGYLNTSTWQAFRIDALTSGAVFYRGNPSVVPTYVTSSTSGSSSPLKVGIYTVNAGTVRLDNVRVRHYAVVDPTVTVGAIEATSGLTLDPLYVWGNGPFSSPAKPATTPSIVPPSALQVNWGSEVKLNLAWTDGNSDETGFKIDRCLDDQCATVQQTFTTTGSQTTYVDSGLTPQTAYCYRIRAYKTATCPWETVSSPIVCRTTVVDPPANLLASKQLMTSCNDLRVTDSDGVTTFNHWLRQGCDTASTLVFPRVPSLPVGSKTLYLYYGNPQAASVSSGAATMDFFEDFTSAAIDTAKWAITDGTGFSQANGLLRGTNTTGRLTSVATFNPPVYLQMRAKTTTRATNGQMIGGFFLSTGNNIGFLDHPGNLHYRTDGTWVAKTDEANNQAPDAYLNYTIALKNSTTANLSVANMDTGATVWAPGDVANGVSNEKIVLGKRFDDSYSGQSYATDWDWVYVRKFAEPFPTAVLGTTEYGTYTVGGVTFSARKPVTVTNATTAALANFQAVIWDDTRPLATERLVLGWTDSYETETGFTIRRCTAGATGAADCDPALTDAGFPVSVGSNVNTYSDFAIALDTKYCYQVKVNVPSAVTGYGTAVCGTLSAATGPTNLVATVTGTRVDLSWTAASPGAPGTYEIERCAGACDFSTRDTFRIPGAQTTWTDPSACSGSYRYRVTSLKPWVSGWSSAYSNEATADIGTPPIPTGLSVQRISETTATLTWSDNTTDETGWKIERRCVSGPASGQCADSLFHQVGSTLPANTGTGAMTFTDQGLVPGTLFEYQVTALKSGVCSWSVGSSAAQVTMTLNGPVSLVATAASSSQVDLSWTDRTSSESGFTVERCADAACTAPVVLTPKAGVNAPYFSDTTVCLGSSPVFYRVKAFREANLSLSGGGVWLKKVPLSITGFQSAFQTRLTINSANYSGMQSDFRDIRFYDETALAELPYWIESISGTTATVWLKTGAYNAISLYYANTAATAASNQDAVFEFSDNFSGSAIDTFRWNVVDPTGFSVSGGMLHGTNTTGRIATRKTFTAPVVLEYKLKTATRPTGGLTTGGFYLSKTSHIGYGQNSSYPFFVQYNGAESSYAYNFSSTNSYRYTITATTATSVTTGVLNMDTAAQIHGPSTFTNSVSNAPVALGRTFNNDLSLNIPYAADWDWVIVRRYAATEPAVSLGAIQSSAGYAFAGIWASDSDYTTVASAVTPDPANLLGNGSFEADGARWTPWGSTVSFDTAAYVDGGRSIKIAVTGSSAGATQNVTVVPGGTYLLSGYLKGALTAGTAQCDLIDLPSAANLDSAGIKIRYSDPANNTGWNYLTETITIPAGVTSAQVRCFLDGSPQGNAGFDAVQIVPVPFSPLSAVRSSESGANLSWNDLLNGESGFLIERCSGAGCNPEPGAAGYKAQSAAANATAFADTLLLPDTTYRYRVKGVKASACSWETAATVTAEVFTASSPPSGLTATATGSNRIDLSWTRGTQGDTGVNVERCSGAGCSNFSTIGTLAAGVTAYADSGACNGVTYNYRISAIQKGLTLDNGGCWNGRAPVSFTGFLTGFQVKLTVNRSSYSGMQADFRDIRFYDTAAEVELPYWIEKISGTTATVWLKTGANNSIVMYYGNSLATDAQNPKKVFEQFDDFNGTSVDATFWNTVNSTGLSVSGGYLHGTNTTGVLRSVQSFVPATVVETKAKTTKFAPNGHNVLGLWYVNSQFYQTSLSANSGNKIVINNGTVVGSTLPVTDVIYSYAVKDTVNADFKATNFDTGAVIAGPTNYNPNQQPFTSFVIHLGLRMRTYIGDYYNEEYAGDWDWVRVRRYAATEPVATAGTGATVTCPNVFSGSWQVPLVSNSAQAATAAQSAPGSLAAVATDSSVQLTWTDTTADEGGFRLERCTVSTGSECDFTTLDAGYPQSYGANSTSATDSSLTSGVPYCYRVKAFKVEPCGEWTSAYSLPACTSLAADRPMTLTASASGPFQVELSWSDDADGESGFEVERKVADGFWSKLATVPAASGTGQAVHFTDSAGIEPGRTYTYRVRSFSSETVSDSFDAGIDDASWTQEGISLTTVLTPPVNIADSGGTARITSTGGAIELATSTPGGSTNNTFNSAKISYLDSSALDGDFDVQVDYDLLEVNLGANPDPAVLHRLARIDVKLPSSAGGSNFIFLERCYNNTIAGHCYLARAWIDGQAISRAISTSDTAGRFRLTRNGDLAGFYVWNAGNWQQVTSVAGISTAPATSIQISQYANRGGAISLRTLVDNFKATIYSKSDYSNDASAVTPSFTPADAFCPVP